MPEVFERKENKDSNTSMKVDPRCLVGVRKAMEELGGGWAGASFFPQKARFETQDDDEQIILLTRKHLITNLKWIFISCFLVFVPFVWGEFPLISGVDMTTKLGLSGVWYLGLGLYVLENMLLWYYTVYIVTDERIVNVDFYELFYKSVDMTFIRNIEDVNYKQVGILTGVFDYGDVTIQTASEQKTIDKGKEDSSFSFDSVPNPDGVVRIVSELMEKEELEMEGRGR